MKPTFSFLCVLSLLGIITVANARSMCTPMKAKEKEMYEETFDTDFMGCTLTLKQSMTALSRMNWMTPAGSMPIVEMDHSADVDMSDIGNKKGMAMVKTGMKVAAASVGRSGMMTVSTECLLSLEPDFVYSCMAKSKSPKVYNAHLAAECKKKGLRSVYATVRADVATQQTGTAVVCLLTSVLSLFFPTLSGSLLDSLKEVVTTLFTVLPCPSNAMTTP